MATSLRNVAPCCTSVGGLAAKLKTRAVELSEKVKKVGVDDPRRIIHSLKFALALTLVSIIYYVNPLYKGFGVSAIWALLTVVFVMENTVGGTFRKGLNRAFATLLGGALGIGAHHLASLSGAEGEPILLGCFVFLLAAAATFSRFIPEIKAKYDYGVLVFILTFTLVAVSSYRVDEIIELAEQRLLTITIGGATSIIISVFLFPEWAGEDLHDLAALNLERLARYLEGLESEYFGKEGGGDNGCVTEEKSFLQVYKSVLNSKATEETLVSLAVWEPSRGRFGYHHPWKQYLKVGALARQCACCMEALNAHVSKSEIQASSDAHRKIRESCRQMCSESSKAFAELGLAIRTMTKPSVAHTFVEAATTVVDSLKNILLKNDHLDEVLHMTTIASILTEIVICTQNIAKSTEELASQANFKSIRALPKTTDAKTISDDESSKHISITMAMKEHVVMNQPLPHILQM